MMKQNASSESLYITFFQNMQKRKPIKKKSAVNGIKKLTLSFTAYLASWYESDQMVHYTGIHPTKASPWSSASAGWPVNFLLWEHLTCPQPTTPLGSPSLNAIHVCLLSQHQGFVLCWLTTQPTAGVLKKGVNEESCVSLLVKGTCLS